MTAATGQTVVVETTARLHFGVLDLRGSLGRWFGGIGAAGPGPAVRVSAAAAPVLSVTGDDAGRARRFAERFLETYSIRSAAAIRVHQALPPHSGLGSGTQLALAVARALAELHGIAADAPALARAVGRGRRSAVGTWTFAGGGLVVEGGRAKDGDAPGPLLVRLPFPRDWHCVVAIPPGAAAISGDQEDSLIAGLEPPPEPETQQVAQLVLMALLPALADGDLPAFGAALTRIQEITGGWFAPAQGGTFLPGPTSALVREMAALGAAGVGQSSWGPAVYGIVGGEDAAARLAAAMTARLGEGQVYRGPFPVEGARVWRA